jgi:hypothetical protein
MLCVCFHLLEALEVDMVSICEGLVQDRPDILQTYINNNSNSGALTAPVIAMLQFLWMFNLIDLISYLQILYIPQDVYQHIATLSSSNTTGNAAVSYALGVEGIKQSPAVLTTLNHFRNGIAKMQVLNPVHTKYYH